MTSEAWAEANRIAADYARHLDDCATRRVIYPTGPCDCGLDTVLARLQQIAPGGETVERAKTKIEHLDDGTIEGIARALRSKAAAEALAPYLKDGESVVECVERNRRDVDILLGQLAASKRRAEAAEARLTELPC